MRRFFVLAALALIVLAPLAGGRTLNGGIGYFNPSGVEGNGGLLYSLGVGQRVDEMVMANIQLDFFNKTFKKETVASVDTSSGSIVSVESRTVEFEHSVKYFPLTAGVIVTLPMGSKINPYIQGRVGYGVAHVSYSYSADVIEGSKPNDGTYTGFCLRFDGGVRLKLGLRSALYLGGYYNNNTVSKSQTASSFTDLKMSGIGLGAGLELSGF